MLNALVAQSVEHLHGKEGVIGSSPIEGSFFIPPGKYFGGIVIGVADHG